MKHDGSDLGLQKYQRSLYASLTSAEFPCLFHASSLPDALGHRTIANAQATGNVTITT